MTDLNAHEKDCPSCKKRFYPQDRVVHKTFCGEEEVCAPPGEKYRAPDCRVYDFCSEECVVKFESESPTCDYVPAWKRFMGKINKTGSSSGIAGVRPHEMYKKCK
jgi:hypothetical protein